MRRNFKRSNPLPIVSFGVHFVVFHIFRPFDAVMIQICMYVFKRSFISFFSYILPMFFFVVPNFCLDTFIDLALLGHSHVSC